MVFRMLAVLAEFERDQISERTKTALAHLRHQGKRISGRIPFGYNLAANGVDLVHNDNEQRAIHLMRELRMQGCSLRNIASVLTQRGISTKTMVPWTPEAIRGILRKVA